MPSGASYGEILRNAREREGLDMATMSRRLHIRPDILKAIETEDFDKMPARGYSKNMVRAYARQLGLDDRKITGMFLRRFDIYDGRTTHDMPVSQPRRSSSRQRTSDARPSGQRPRQRSQHPSRSQSLRTGSSAKQSRGIGGLLGDSSNSRRLSQSFSTGSLSTSFASQSRNSNSIFANANLMFFVAIAIVAVVIIALIVVLFNGSRQSAEQVPDIPISGLTDTSSPDDSIEPTPVLVAPSSAIFSFSVEDGQSSWIEIYENGSSTPIVAEAITGPYTKDYEVTNTLRFRTANPGPITIAVDGREENLVRDPETNYYTYTVDFPSILSAWRAEHEAGDNLIDDGNTAISSKTTTSSGSSSGASSASSTS